MSAPDRDDDLPGPALAVAVLLGFALALLALAAGLVWLGLG